MALHDGRNELVSALAKINPRLAMVLVGGSPVEMPWIDEVPAVIQMWYAGMEAGSAIADVLFGRVNPSGKTGAVRRAGPLRSPPRRELAGYPPGDRGRALTLF